LQLAALSLAANTVGTGSDLAAKIKSLGVLIAAGNAINSVVTQTAYANALTAVNGGGGVSNMLPSGVSTGPILAANIIPTYPIVDVAATAITLAWDSTGTWDGSNTWR